MAAKSADERTYGSHQHTFGYLPLLSVHCIAPLMTGLLLTPESTYPLFPLSIQHMLFTTLCT